MKFGTQLKYVPSLPIVEAYSSDFWRRVRFAHGCMEWTGPRGADGYGRFRVGERVIGAHRFALLSAGGRLRRRQLVDHLCRNPSCVNPLHLEAVSASENVKRGLRGGPRRPALVKAPDIAPAAPSASPEAGEDVAS